MVFEGEVIPGVTNLTSFVPIIALGIILGLYELILIHRDENFRGSHWLGHGFHSVFFMFIALFFVFNTEYFLNITGLAEKGWPFISNPWAVRVVIGLILNIKMHVTSAVIKGGLRGSMTGGMAEHWTHTTIVSVLVILAPLYWPILATFLPEWAGGTTSNAG
ncbi:hypothetical protein J4230_04330 [Candidatus Woesearchaeota archaeon]|nr:hypothetical protein [Candidatus Woesearchaeota archaeon]